MRVFSDLVITFKSGRTFVAQDASYKFKDIATYRLWGPLNLNEAHSAVPGYREALMVAEPGYLYAANVSESSLTRPQRRLSKWCS